MKPLIRKKFALWIALAAAACGSDEPIVARGCATEADCASDEVCRSGQCAAIAAGPDGAAAAASDARELACIGPQATITAGQDCACPDDCDATEVCSDELSTGAPGGMCLRGCSEEACPAGLTCIELVPGDIGTASCLLSCTVTPDCPAGDICQTLEPGGPLVCIPNCQADSDCPTHGSCDQYTGVCGSLGIHPGTADIGDACTRDADCISAFCLPPSPLSPGGLCTAFCSLSRQGCPDGSACTANWSAVGDAGLCFARCTTVAECRQGYVCDSYPDRPGDVVCAPQP